MKLIFTLTAIALLSIKAIAQDYTVPEKASFNTDAEESFPIVSNNTIYFNRNFTEENIGGKWGGEDIWSVTEDNQTATTSPMNTKYNDVIVGISADGNTMYLMNTSGKKPKAGISVTKKENGEWTQRETLPIEIEEQGAHYGLYMLPSEDVLFVSANNIKSKGEEDLFVMVKEGDKWTEAISLGDKINTTQSEISPYYNPATKTLYYATNGRADGKGNYDLYKTTRTGEGWDEWSEPENLGDQINTTGYEAYLFKVSDEEIYFVRNAGELTSDIYKTSIIIEEPTPEPTPDPEPTEDTIIASITPELEPTPAPEPTPIAPKETKTPEKVTVNFANNSSALTQYSSNKLDQVVSQMKANKSLKVTLEGHTCDLGETQYNLWLSKKRAQAAKDYLIKSGIDESRITSITGAGEQQPSHDNKTEKEKNRRVEILFTF